MTSSGILLKKIDAIGYFDQFISEGVYQDGRDTGQFRPFTIEQAVDPKVYGSAYVKQGGSCVSCSISLSIAPSSTEAAIVYELQNLDTVPQALVDEATANLSALMARNVFVDPDDLNADSGLRWTLHLKIMALSADGFLTDALLTAVAAALLDVKLPSVKYRQPKKEENPLQENFEYEFDVNNIEIDRSSFSQLTLRDIPVFSGFLLYSGKTASEEVSLLYDPARELCELISNRCEVIIGKNGRIYHMSASGGVALNASLVSEMLLVAQRRHTAIMNALKRINPRLKQ